MASSRSAGGGARSPTARRARLSTLLRFKVLAALATLLLLACCQRAATTTSEAGARALQLGRHLQQQQQQQQQQPLAPNTASKCASITGGDDSSSSAEAGGANCTLNPAFLFSLPPPQRAADRTLLLVTAMRFRCLAHATQDVCAADLPDWCSWTDGGTNDTTGSSSNNSSSTTTSNNINNSTCSLAVADADWPALLLWGPPALRLACAGTPLGELVRCSDLTPDPTACAATRGCAWADAGAARPAGCVPKRFLPVRASARRLAAFKAQAQAADPAVWGANCTDGASVFQLYAAACNHTSAAACAAAAAGCAWVPNGERRAATLDPLNLTRACHASSARAPVERVFFDASASAFGAAALEAELGCAALSGGGGGDGRARCTAERVAVGSATTALLLANASAGGGGARR